MSRQLQFIADMSISQTASGLAGEYLAAASILARGWRVSLAQQDAVDLICWHPETSEMFRVQVKACQASRQGAGHKHKVFFQTGLGGAKRLPTPQDYDIMACVSSEQRSVWYLPVTDVNTKKLVKHVSFFENAHNEPDSWQRSIEIMREYRNARRNR